MKMKSLFAVSAVAIAAVPLALFTASQSGIAAIPSLAATNKSFTYTTEVGRQYWQPDGYIGNWEQNVETGQGTPIASRIELPYEKYCDRKFGDGALFYYQTNGGSGSFNFSMGVNNLQNFEFSFHQWNSGWNMAFAEFHAAITYKDGKDATVHSVNYDLVNGGTVNENSDLHANTPNTYSWTRTEDIVGGSIRSVSVVVSFSSASRIFMDYITVGWSC